MIITVDRNGGLFPPSICDLINIKSQRINKLIGTMNVPKIEQKETLQPLFVNFRPVEVIERTPYVDPVTGEIVPDVNVYSVLKINKMEHHCYTLGKVHFISLVFSDISAVTYAQRDGEEIKPENIRKWFATSRFHKLAELGMSPEEDMHFRAIPLNPSKEENPDTVDDKGEWSPLGSPLIIKVKPDRNIYFKGLIFDGAKVPVYNFFITNI